MKLDPMDIACCPYCDNLILVSDPACVVEAEGAKCLAHLWCHEDATEDANMDDDDEDEGET